MGYGLHCRLGSPSNIASGSGYVRYSPRHVHVLCSLSEVQSENTSHLIFDLFSMGAHESAISGMV